MQGLHTNEALPKDWGFWGLRDPILAQVLWNIQIDHFFHQCTIPATLLFCPVSAIAPTLYHFGCCCCSKPFRMLIFHLEQHTGRGEFIIHVVLVNRKAPGESQNISQGSQSVRLSGVVISPLCFQIFPPSRLGGLEENLHLYRNRRVQKSPAPANMPPSVSSSLPEEGCQGSKYE